MTADRGPVIDGAATTDRNRATDGVDATAAAGRRTGTRGTDKIRPFRHPDRHHVAVLVMHGVIPFELGIPSRIFGGACDLDGGRLYEVVTCSPEPGPVQTDADFPIVVKYGPEVLA